jgi:hypothetical protein
MIHLTNRNDKNFKFYVDPNQVAAVWTDPTSLVTLVRVGTTTLYVAETPEQVRDLVERDRDTHR